MHVEKVSQNTTSFYKLHHLGTLNCKHKNHKNPR